MSWSIAMIGKGSALKRKFQEYVDNQTHMIASEKVTLDKLSELVAHEVDSAPNAHFKLEGYGSVSEYHRTDAPDIITRNVKFEMQTVEIVADDA